MLPEYRRLFGIAWEAGIFRKSISFSRRAASSAESDRLENLPGPVCLRARDLTGFWVRDLFVSLPGSGEVKRGILERLLLRRRLPSIEASPIEDSLLKLLEDL